MVCGVGARSLRHNSAQPMTAVKVPEFAETHLHIPPLVDVVIRQPHVEPYRTCERAHNQNEDEDEDTDYQTCFHRTNSLPGFKCIVLPRPIVHAPLLVG